MAGAGTGKKKDKAVDALSPKKPRLQKNSPKAVKKHKDRNPFRYCFNNMNNTKTTHFFAYASSHGRETLQGFGTEEQQRTTDDAEQRIINCL